MNKSTVNGGLTTTRRHGTIQGKGTGKLRPRLVINNSVPHEMMRKGQIVSAALTAVVVRKKGEKEAIPGGTKGGVRIAGMFIPKRRAIGEKEMMR